LSRRTPAIVVVQPTARSVPCADLSDSIEAIHQHVAAGRFKEPRHRRQRRGGSLARKDPPGDVRRSTPPAAGLDLSYGLQAGEAVSTPATIRGK
jgi:hypothetical protein